MSGGDGGDLIGGSYGGGTAAGLRRGVKLVTYISCPKFIAILLLVVYYHITKCKNYIFNRLGIVDSIKLEAKNLYMKANDLKLFNIRKKQSVCAACLYIACRQANKARTIKGTKIMNNICWTVFIYYS